MGSKTLVLSLSVLVTISMIILGIQSGNPETDMAFAETQNNPDFPSSGKGHSSCPNRIIPLPTDPESPMIPFGETRYMWSFNFTGYDKTCLKSSHFGYLIWHIINHPIDLKGDSMYSGWSMMDFDSWLEHSDSGDRRSFSLADGIIAVADADEWWDKNDHVAKFDSGLYTPLFPIPSDSTALNLLFSSHYEQKGNQKRDLVLAVFDKEKWHMHDILLPIENKNGKNQLLLFNSDFGDYDEAGFVRIEWRLYDAQNDFYWAIDDPKIMFLQNKGIDLDNLVETFTDVGPKMNEINEKGDDMRGKWSKVPPRNWSVVNSPPALDGSQEFSGWTFMDKDAWIKVADGTNNNRKTFDLGQGFVAVADPDEWNDFSHHGVPTFDSTLVSPKYNISPGDNYVFVDFSSHYKQKGLQTGTLSVKYYSSLGYPLDSITPDRLYVETELNSQETYQSLIPRHATHFTVNWELSNAQNDWYWAIDNVYINTDSKSEFHVDGFEDMDHDEDWSFSTNSGNRGDANFRGWSLMNSIDDWVHKATEDQDRRLFTKSRGNLLVADVDEWHDGLRIGEDPSFSAKLYSPFYKIPDDATKAHIEFDSHYRQKGNQAGHFYVLGDELKEHVLGKITQDYVPKLLDTFDTNRYNTHESYTINLDGYDHREIGFIWSFGSNANDYYWAIDNFAVFFSSEPAD